MFGDDGDSPCRKGTLEKWKIEISKCGKIFENNNSLVKPVTYIFLSDTRADAAGYDVIFVLIAFDFREYLCRNIDKYHLPDSDQSFVPSCFQLVDGTARKQKIFLPYC